MANDWDEYAQTWNDNPDVITYSEKAFQSLRSTLDIQGLRILDFGCGTGLLTEKLALTARSVVALDTSEQMLMVLQAKRLPRVTCISAELSGQSIAAEPELTNQFDLIVASSVCSFLPDYLNTLSLCKRLLLPEGHFIQWDWLAATPDEFGMHPDKIAQTFQQVGLHERSITTAFHMTSHKGQMPVVMGVGQNP